MKYPRKLDIFVTMVSEQTYIPSLFRLSFHKVVRSRQGKIDEYLNGLLAYRMAAIAWLTMR
jgi:hypothetical protein